MKILFINKQSMVFYIPRDADHGRNDFEFVIVLSLVFCCPMIIDVQINVKISS